MTAPVISIIESATARDESRIKAAWEKFQEADRYRAQRGLEFGKAMYEYRAKHSAQGRRTDLTSSTDGESSFSELLRKLEIPSSTAYKWITRYEESIGIKQKPAPVIEAGPVEIISPVAETPAADEITDAADDDDRGDVADPEPEPATSSKSPRIPLSNVCRLFGQMHAMNSVMDIWDESGQDYQFGDKSEGFLATAKRLRNHLSQLIKQLEEK